MYWLLLILLKSSLADEWNRGRTRPEGTGKNRDVTLALRGERKVVMSGGRGDMGRWTVPEEALVGNDRERNPG